MPEPVIVPCAPPLLTTTAAPGPKVAPEATVNVPGTLKLAAAPTVAAVLEIVRLPYVSPETVWAPEPA